MAIHNSAMAEYLANQIYNKKLDYEAVIRKYPRYKEVIDATLAKYDIIPVIEEEN